MTESVIGEKIRVRRKELNLTLEELARKISVSRQTIQRYETGAITNIPSRNIELMARALRVTPAYLMGWQEEGVNPPEIYSDEELHCINAMTTLLQYLYDEVDFQEHILCDTFEVTLVKGDTKIVLDEDEYNLLFDFVCSNIPNYIQLIKGKTSK